MWDRSVGTGHVAGRSIIRGLSLCALAFCLIQPSLSQTTPEDEAALRVLVERYFDLFARKDLNGFMALWSPTSPEISSRRESMSRRFAASDSRFSRLALSRVNIEGERAALRAACDQTEVVSQTMQGRTQRLVTAFALVKEGTTWKIWRSYPAAEDLASSLERATSEAERAVRLAEEKELVSTQLVDALVARGQDCQNRRDLVRALALSQLAQAIAEQIGYRPGLATALDRFGEILYEQRNHAQALEYYGKSMQLFEELGNTAALARTHLSIGNVYVAQSNLAGALGMYRKGLELAESAGRRPLVAFALQNLGVVTYRQGNLDQALEYYRRSLSLLEELGNQAELGRICVEIGRIHLTQGNHGQAMAFLQRGLPLAEATGQKRCTATAMYSIGLTRSRQGEYPQSIEAYQKSWKLYEELGDRGAAAGALNNIGCVYLSQRQNSLALEFLQKSLRLHEELGDRAAVAGGLINVGIVYASQGNHAQALEHYRSGLELAEASGHKLWAANALLDSGLIMVDQGNYSLALERLRKCQRLYHEELADPVSTARALFGIGRVHYAREDYLQALEFFRKGLALQELRGQPGDLAHALVNVAQASRALGRYNQALELSGRAAEVAARIGHANTYANARIVAGDTYRELKQSAAARQAYEEAIASVESTRAQVAGSQEQQGSFLADNIGVYDSIVDLLARDRRPEEAFAYAERARARLLLEILNSGRANVDRAMSPAERTREEELDGHLLSLNAQLFNEQQRRQPDQVRVRELADRLEKAKREYEAFRDGLYTAHSELRAWRGEGVPLTAEAAGRWLRGQKGSPLLVMEYVVTDQRTWLFLLDASGRVNAHPIKLTRRELERRAGELRVALEEQAEGRLGSLTRIDVALRQLDFLVAPAASLLAGSRARAPARGTLGSPSGTPVCIVPDGPLWEVPFGALKLPSGQRLVERSPVFYAPSVTALQAMTQGRRKLRAAPASLMAMAPFAYSDSGEPRGTREIPFRGAFGPLSASEKEVAAIAQLYRSRPTLREAATESRAKQEMSRAKLLHFATHALIDPVQGLYSGLVLAPEPAAPSDGKDERRRLTEDGYLEAREILELDLRADLAVLSACETARGQNSRGEGMVGLSWALFVAGCPSTLASQWKVNDASTAELMVSFYRHLKAGMGKAEALRLAQLGLLRGRAYRHPYYWSPFLLVGDWR